MLDAFLYRTQERVRGRPRAFSSLCALHWCRSLQAPVRVAYVCASACGCGFMHAPHAQPDVGLGFVCGLSHCSHEPHHTRVIMPHALFAHFHDTLLELHITKTTGTGRLSDTDTDRRKLVSRSGARPPGCRYNASCRQGRATQTKDVAGAPASQMSNSAVGASSKSSSSPLRLASSPSQKTAHASSIALAASSNLASSVTRPAA